MSESKFDQAQGVIDAAIDRLENGRDEDFRYDDRCQTLSRLQNLCLHRHYSEPGYSTEAGIVVGNANITLAHRWEFKDDQDKQADETLRREANKRSLLSRVLAALDRLGFEFEWEDEWITCDDCGGLVRCSPNSYGWQQYFYRDEENGTLICGDCVKSSGIKDYIAWLEGNARRAMTFDVDLLRHGYFRVDRRFERGLHHGQDADPNRVAAELKKHGVERFIFSRDSVGQFDFDFSVWVHQDEAGLLKQVDLSDEVVNGPSVSAAMELGLRAASALTKAPPDGPGVAYAKIYGDGSALAAKIPPPEFVEHGVRNVEARLDQEHERQICGDAGTSTSG